MAKKLTGFSQLCVHTITTKPWSIEEAIVHYSNAGIRGISVWRDTLEGKSIKKIGERIRSNNLDIVSLVRGGFFPSISASDRQKSIDDNRRAIDEAAALGAPIIVLVPGADPGQSLETSRKQITEGIEKVLPHAEANNIKLAVEPLHPMYAGKRSAINTLAQANDLVEKIDSPYAGVAVDVYHLWWDPDLEMQIRRCGQNDKLFAFHICDWRVPTIDMLNDRGLMGEGCIPIQQIRGWVEETGFQGYYEVEIFSNRLWGEDQHQFLVNIKNAYLKNS